MHCLKAHGSFGAVYTENAEHRQTVEYFIILIVILALAAKLTHLHTPRREKQLAATRARGREAGLRVELVRGPWSGDRSTGAPVVRYLLHWPLNFDTGAAGFTPWALVYGVARGRESPWNGWRWQDLPAPDLVSARLGEILGSLPNDAAAVQCDRSGVAVYWGEQGGVEAVERLLDELKNIRKIYI